MLALYLGLYFQLPRPYWAMASVIVSNPFVGATRSKALYRALGTALGAAAAIFFVPPFVETPLLFAIIVATWCGTRSTLAISDRTARSYVFMLAGYTMPLVALPTVTDPSTVFDVAIARTERSCSASCASVVGSAIFPNRLAPTLIERTDAWFKDAAFYGRETLSGHIAGKALSACRQRLAATITGLEFLLSQLSYDHAHPRILARAQALAGRMQLFLPLMSLADPLIALMRDLHIRPAADELLADAATWFDAPLPAVRRHRRRHDRRPGRATPARTHRRAAAGRRRARELGRRAAVERAVAAAGHRHLAGLPLARADRQRRGVWQPRYRHWRRHRALLRSRDDAVLDADGGRRDRVRELVWIASGWHDGAAAVTLVAVSCSFFAALDGAPLVFKFFLATTASVVFAGLYFVVLPRARFRDARRDVRSS